MCTYIKLRGTYEYIPGDQKFSVHLMITIYISGAQRLFDHPVHRRTYIRTYTQIQNFAKIEEDVGLAMNLKNTRNMQNVQNYYKSNYC